MTDHELPHTPLWLTAASRLIRSLPAGRYRAMNWVARRQRRPFWATLPSDLGGFQFRCDLRDPLMREVCITGRYEPQETALLQRMLGPGMTFVDVGANWGYFTLAAAHLVGPTGRVVSIEADPRASRTLGANVRRNRLSRVTIVSAAASDAAGTIRVRPYGSGADDSSNFGVALADGLAADDGEGRMPVDIPAQPLDTVLECEGIHRVDLLKMDIEGAEGRALRGLHRFLTCGVIDRIVLELHPAHLSKQGTSPEAIVRGLQAHGYRAWHIDHSPAAHRRSASGPADIGRLLTPLADAGGFGEWPHLLLARRGLEPIGSDAGVSRRGGSGDVLNDEPVPARERSA